MPISFDRPAIPSTAVDGVEAIAAFRATRPDVVVLDVEMPRIDGVEALRRIRSVDASARVLILSGHGHEGLIAQCTEGGASGFVLKGGSVDEMTEGIRAVAAGRTFFGRGVKEKIGLSLGRPRVSTREREMLPLLAAW